MASSRIKNYTTIQQEVTAIQIVRNAIGDVYEFINFNDCTFSFKGDKFSGVLTDENGNKLAFNGKDYCVKDSDEHISVLSKDVFESTYILKETE